MYGIHDLGEILEECRLPVNHWFQTCPISEMSNGAVENVTRVFAEQFWRKINQGYYTPMEPVYRPYHEHPKDWIGRDLFVVGRSTHFNVSYDLLPEQFGAIIRLAETGKLAFFADTILRMKVLENRSTGISDASVEDVMRFGPLLDAIVDDMTEKTDYELVSLADKGDIRLKILDEFVDPVGYSPPAVAYSPPPHYCPTSPADHPAYRVDSPPYSPASPAYTPPPEEQEPRSGKEAARRKELAKKLTLRIEKAKKVIREIASFAEQKDAPAEVIAMIESYGRGLKRARE